MTNTATVWFKQHPRSTAALALLVRARASRAREHLGVRNYRPGGEPTPRLISSGRRGRAKGGAERDASPFCVQGARKIRGRSGVAPGATGAGRDA